MQQAINSHLLYVFPPDVNMKKEKFFVGTLYMCLNADGFNGKVAPFHYSDKYEKLVVEDIDDVEHIRYVNNNGNGCVCVKRTNVIDEASDVDDASDNNSDDEEDNRDEYGNGDKDSFHGSDSNGESDVDDLNEGKVQLYVVFNNMGGTFTISKQDYYIGTRPMCLRYIRHLRKKYQFTRNHMAVYRLNINDNEFDHLNEIDLTNRFVRIVKSANCMKCEFKKNRNGEKYCDVCLADTNNSFCEACGVIIHREVLDLYWATHEMVPSGERVFCIKCVEGREEGDESDESVEEEEEEE